MSRSLIVFKCYFFNFWPDIKHCNCGRLDGNQPKRGLSNFAVGRGTSEDWAFNFGQNELPLTKDRCCSDFMIAYHARH